MYPSLLKTIFKKLTFIFLSTLFLVLVEKSYSQIAFDKTFGNNGFVMSDFGEDDVCYSIKLLDNNNILAVGSITIFDGFNHRDFALARYLPNGNLDLSFGVNGLIHTDIGSRSDDVAKCVEILPNKKILVAGSTKTDADFAVLRYSESGIIDSTFGENGKSLIDFGGWDYCTSIAIQKDEKILLSGYRFLNETEPAIVTVRVTSEGHIDSSFGHEGKVITTFRNLTYGVSLLIQDDSKIIVSGFEPYYDDSLPQPVVIRYNMYGAIDSSFATNGVFKKSFPNIISEVSSSVLTTDKKILLGCSGVSFGHWNASFLQLNNNGTIDSSFGENGLSISSFSGLNVYSQKIILQNDGKFIAGGTAETESSNKDFILARYSSKGILDSSFGVFGKVVATIPERNEYLNSLAIQPDKKIVIGGSSQNLHHYNGKFALARYSNEIVLATSLQNFTVSKIDHKALLTWQTKSEQNNNYFSVQRSIDGNTFFEISQIKSKGNSNTLQYYSFTDIKPKAGTNYYRLKQVDADNHFIYSSIIKVDFNETTAIKITPNLVQRLLVVKGLGSAKSLVIADITGNIKGKANSVNDVYNWDVQQLTAGTYYLIVEDKGKQIVSLKFIKQ
ncbi:T9SS type A sorting domain-containing protein [Panacibacter ginsenosidivorans]|uniref:T9SS type A sorting domain-containing protein n=1 Tax=Panacibacter ginsenosidivorans TaxID=1813871 RepID=A0A5B8VBG4_9BACT|nr:T9SS type A sorting domain-containing protein [Panacibacter ginsenosidivorans]QEC68609.1 T9SS type A sorting domain-containing protein [Panacibacter ginsenosidivorans]